MGIFKRKGDPIEEGDIVTDGLVRAFVDIKRIDRSTRKVKATLTDCSTGKMVYKATYQTQAKTDFYAYENAKDDLKRVMKREDLVLYGEVGTNSTDMPYVRNVNKRSR